MYDSNYFKKIIGENVDPNNYFERTTNSLIINNDSNQINGNINTKDINNRTLTNSNTNFKDINNSAQVNNDISNVQTNNNINNSKINENITAQDRSQPRQYNSTSNSINMRNDDEIYNMYPDTYKIIMPMIEEAVKRRSGQNITEQFIQDVTNEVFTAIEVESNINKNKILYDLIQILVIDFLANNFSITQTTSVTPYPEDY